MAWLIGTVERPVLPTGYRPSSEPGPATTNRTTCPVTSRRFLLRQANCSMAPCTFTCCQAQGWDRMCASSRARHAASGSWRPTPARATVRSFEIRADTAGGIGRRFTPGPPSPQHHNGRGHEVEARVGGDRGAESASAPRKEAEDQSRSEQSGELQNLEVCSAEHRRDQKQSG